MNDYPYNREPITEEGMLSSVYGLPFYEKVDVQQLIDEAYADQAVQAIHDAFFR